MDLFSDCRSDIFNVISGIAAVISLKLKDN